MAQTGPVGRPSRPTLVELTQVGRWRPTYGEESLKAVDSWSMVPFSLLLLLAAAGMMVSHVRAWRKVRGPVGEAEPREIEYRLRQLRRRVQTTAMLAILAVALAVGHWITLERVDAVVFSAYWGCMLLLVLWVALLAVADMVSTRHHFGRMQQRQLMERVKLEAELRRIQARRGNGKPSVTHDNSSQGAQGD